ncbi:MAG: hypothetical protein ACYSR5_03095 [Planctomycetota bacterium]|jgi:hypothetical protein
MQEDKVINWLSEKTKLLVPLVALAVAGCHRGYEEDPLAYGPDVNSIVVTSDYGPRTIGATGGYQAWIETTKLELNYIVTFYRPDGRFYLTEQHQEIYPWSNSIRISAREPQGKFVWLLSAGDFSELKGDEWGVLERRYKIRDVLQAVLDITTAPVRFLDRSVEFDRASEPVKKEGRWYYRIERIISDADGRLSKSVFYQDTGSALVEMVWFAGERSLVVRGHDYRQIGAKAVLLPAKIEIYEADAKGVLQQRLVKMDFK